MKIRNYRFFVIIAAMCLFVSGCNSAWGEQGASSSRYVESMDTVMKLSAYGKNRENALDLATEEINRLNALLSTEYSGSELFRLNQLKELTLSEDAGILMKYSLDLFSKTNGAFDITIYPLTCAWGFPQKEYRVPTEVEIQTTLSLIDASRIQFDVHSGHVLLGPKQSVDFGGIAKGYTSQRIMDIFKENGVTSGLVTLGGNVQCCGTKPDGTPWTIGIQDPQNRDSIIATVKVADKAVITSGGYERFFVDESTGVKYQHILNPETGYPVNNEMASVTILSDDGTLADGLSTALFVMGIEKATEFWRNNSSDFQAIFIDQENCIYITEGLKNAFHSEKQVNVLSISP